MTLNISKLTIDKAANFAVNHTDLSGCTVSGKTLYRGEEQSASKPTPAPLTCDCTDCDGEGRVYKSRYGGNDPDGWLIRCDTCAGDGEYVRLCDKARCDAHATELVTFADCSEPYCSAHADEMRCEAVGEALAALTSWNRAVAGYHMKLWLRLSSGSAEMCEVGRELLEDGLGEWFRLPRETMMRIAQDAAA